MTFRAFAKFRMFELFARPPGAGEAPSVALHSQFVASGANGELHAVPKGSGALTEGRASSIWMRDHEKIFREWRLNELGIRGARQVRNLFAGPTDNFASETVTVVVGDEYRVSMRGTGSIAISGAASETVVGEAGKRKCSAVLTAATTSLVCTVSGTVTDAQCERVSGQSNRSPGEYVPSGTGQNSGLGLNGVAAYNTENGNSVVSGEVIEATGSALAEAGLLAHAQAATNYLPESHYAPAWSGTAGKSQGGTGFDGKPGGAMIFEDDDVASRESATDDAIIANDSNDYAAVYIVPKAPAPLSAFPRLAFQILGGTSPGSVIINIDHYNGTTRNISAGVHSVIDMDDCWAFVLSIANNGLGNTIGRANVFPANSATLAGGSDNTLLATFEVRHVAVYRADLKNAEALAAFPIPTSGAQASRLICNLSANQNNHPAAGGVYCEFDSGMASADMSGKIEILSLAGAADLLYYDTAFGQYRSFDGVNTASVAQSIAANTLYKLALIHTENALRIAVNGVWGTEVPYNGNFPGRVSLEFFRALAHVGTGRTFRFYASDSKADLKATLDALMA